MSSVVATVAMVLTVWVVHGALSLALHQLAWSARRRGAARWLPRAPWIAFAIVVLGTGLAAPFVWHHPPLGLVLGGVALAVAWLAYGLVVVLLLRRRL